MKPTTLMGLVMIAAAVTAMWRPDVPPVETTVEAPDATVQAVVAPVSAKLAERSRTQSCHSSTTSGAEAA